MKKQIIEKTLKEVEIIKSTEYFCDRCGKTIGEDIGEKYTNKIIFKTEEHLYYCGGGCVEYDQAYFCNGCAEVIKNMLKDIGVKFEHVEYDY